MDSLAGVPRLQPLKNDLEDQENAGTLGTSALLTDDGDDVIDLTLSQPVCAVQEKLQPPRKRKAIMMESDDEDDDEPHLPQFNRKSSRNPVLGEIACSAAFMARILLVCDCAFAANMSHVVKGTDSTGFH